MSQELTLNCSMSFAKGNVQSKSLSISSNSKFDVSGTRYLENVMTIPTTAGGTAIDIPAGTLGYAMFKNLDATNYIELMTLISTGIVFCKLLPGEIALLRLGSGAQTPAAIAHTSSVQLEYMICEA